MKVLCTGSRGYVGSNLTPRLHKKDYGIIHYDLADGFDIRDLEKLKSAISVCGAVVHLAAIAGVKRCCDNRTEAYNVNVQGTVNVMKAAGSKLAVLFSSQAALGDTFYGWTKKLVEQQYGGKSVILRPSNIYGGIGYLVKKESTAIACFSRDTPIKVLRPKERRDFVHVSKVCEAVLDALQGRLKIGVHDVKSGDEMSIETLARIIGTVRGVKVNLK